MSALELQGFNFKLDVDEQLLRLMKHLEYVYSYHINMFMKIMFVVSQSLVWLV